jgi:A/G-specific adenine glycosylase
MPPVLDDRVLALRRSLLDWYAVEARPLAWRTTRDPWRILVSEIMLQQTQATRVEPLWLAFCARFPTPAALAAAPVGEVLTWWRGLGYNRRAVNLHRAATVIADEHGGVVPADLDGLLALPGIGDYTARAVQAFAFGLDAAPVDTNVGRVLARAVRGEVTGRAALQRLAQALVPEGRGHPWNQALMDLGARVCTARSPRCPGCPLERTCAWRSTPSLEDPAASGGAAARPQAAFAGSDRYHRGRLVDALRGGPVAAGALLRAADLEDPARIDRITAGLVADGLAEWEAGLLRLPA